MLPDDGEVTPTPEWFFALLMTHVVPVVLLFAVAGTVLGVLVKAVSTAVRRTLGERQH